MSLDVKAEKTECTFIPREYNLVQSLIIMEADKCIAKLANLKYCIWGQTIKTIWMHQKLRAQ